MVVDVSIWAIVMLHRDIIWCKLPGTIFPPPVIIDEMISNDIGAIFGRQRNETLVSFARFIRDHPFKTSANFRDF